MTKQPTSKSYLGSRLTPGAYVQTFAHARQVKTVFLTKGYGKEAVCAVYVAKSFPSIFALLSLHSCPSADQGIIMRYSTPIRERATKCKFRFPPGLDIVDAIQFYWRYQEFKNWRAYPGDGPTAIVVLQVERRTMLDPWRGDVDSPSIERSKTVPAGLRPRMWGQPI